MSASPRLEDYERIPDSVYADDFAPKPNGHTARPAIERRPALNWDDIEGKEPPEREWVLPYWLPAGHITLLAGRPGVGKTLLAQHIATAVALGGEYISAINPRRVLMWAGEDDESELWRRQLPISRHFGSALSALTERFLLHSFAGTDITLMAPVFGQLQTTPMLTELTEQVRDYGASFVILDNIARLFGGSENDRHAVTTFCAIVQGACAPATVLLLGHPAKAQGSEFSGSTAWEGAVRARLYLSDRPPDVEGDADSAPDATVRYLSRRKANYSPLDVRRLTLSDGVLTPDRPSVTTPAAGISGDFAKDTVRRAITKLSGRQVYGSLSTGSHDFLPKLAKQYDLLGQMSQKQFAATMRCMLLAGEIAKAEVSKYQNRTPRMGLVLP